MNTTEYAAKIRAELKRRHGWTSRQVSVRGDYFSMGSAIRVTIKDPAVPLEPVRRVAGEAEQIHRDQMTGEILGGGNRYVDVTYSMDARKILGRRYADAVQRAVDAIDPNDTSRLEPVTGTTFLVGRPNPYGVSLWDQGSSHCLQGMGTVDSIAQTIGVLQVEREANARAA